MQKVGDIDIGILSLKVCVMEKI